MNGNTRCIACGTRLPNGEHFCDGYRGGYDTYQCQCDCHWVPANRFYATGTRGRLLEQQSLTSK